MAMRVLVMVARDPENPYLGGGELTFAEWSKELVRSGHSVDYLCATFPGSPREGEFDGVRVHRLSGEHSLGASAFLEYRRRYAGKVDVVLEDMLGGSRLPFFAPLYAREPVITVWHQDHGPIFENQYSPLLWPALAALEKILLRAHRDCFVLTPSRQSANSFAAKGGDPSRARIYRPGLAADLLRAGVPPAFEDRKPWILCLGKIRRYKSAHIAVEVLARVLPKVPEAELFIAGRMGQPEYYTELQQLAAERGLGSRVHFEINVSEERKRELLRSCRVLLATAPIEGFGVAVLEAGAYGLPVVATTGVPEDALREGVNGFRVPIGDLPRMSSQTVRVLADPDAFAPLSQGGYRLAQGSSWARSATTLLAVLSELFPPARGSGATDTAAESG
jgi:glycosyltransferase involved in cell wall biosynthesis